LKNYSSISEIQKALASNQTNCLSLVNYYLDRIEAHQDLNIFIETFSKRAREEALRIDNKIKLGTAGKLAGVVVALKDNLCFEGQKVTASSKILSGFESLFSATVVERLLKEDAIIIGRVACDEFAMGSSNENSCYGPVKNPKKPSNGSWGFFWRFRCCSSG
jgi:aspartyl-tRNA(Asn)/glutamyl-tRNA(Gln) amidotransferase subunit A